MQILYGGMPDKELITIAEEEYRKETKVKREKMSKQAKLTYKMFQMKDNVPQKV